MPSLKSRLALRRSPPRRHPGTSTLASELEALRAEKATLASELKKREALENDAKSLLAQLQEKVQLSENDRAKLASERRAETIKHAAEVAAYKHRAISNAQVVKLIYDDLDIDPEGKVVSKSDPKVDVDGYVKSYLDGSPWLAQPAVAAGSGASPAASTSAPQVRPPGAYDLRTREGATQRLRDEIMARVAEAEAAAKQR